MTDRRRAAAGDSRFDVQLKAFTEAVSAAASAGADIIQVREPDVDGRDLCTLVGAAVAVTRSTGCRVVVNDRADIALAAGADGVHLRAAGIPVQRARAIGPPGWIVGRSAHDDAELRAAVDADYVIYGTIFRTESKPGVVGQGIERLAAAARAVSCPVLAIGGVTLERLPELARCGASGIAAISLFLPASVDGVGPDVAVRAARAAFGVALT